MTSHLSASLRVLHTNSRHDRGPDASCMEAEVKGPKRRYCTVTRMHNPCLARGKSSASVAYFFLQRKESIASFSATFAHPVS